MWHIQQTRNVYRVLIGKPGRKRSLGRPRSIWEDNIKMNLREVGCDTGNWIDVAQDREAYVRMVMNCQVR